MGLKESKVVDPSLYRRVPFTVYESLEEKLEALMSGKTLLVRGLGNSYQSDVLIRMENKKYQITQISYTVSGKKKKPRQWISYNIGLNDLSLLTVYRYNPKVFSYPNKFRVNDVVTYYTSTGEQERAIVEDVYISKSNPTSFVYSLSWSNRLHFEEDLEKHPYL